MNKYYYENIYWRGTDLWPAFAGKKIFVAGGLNGFYASWFIGFLTYLKEEKGIPLELQYGSRSTGWEINDANTYTQFQKEANYIINCAGCSSASLDISEVMNHHIAGPISLVSAMRGSAVMLQISSGVVSDRPMHEAGKLNLYADAKRASEHFLMDMNANVRIARPFATIGPGMGLDKHFAISTFIRNKLEGKPLQVSNRALTRSFVHITDLMVQLFHVLMGESKVPYQVGSDDKITMLEAAQMISSDIVMVDTDFPANGKDEYVADLTRVKTDFNLGLDFTSKSSIMNTYHHYASNPVAVSNSGIVV